MNNLAEIVSKRIASKVSPKFAAINPNWKNYERSQPTVVSTEEIPNSTPPNQFSAPIFMNDLNDTFDEHALLKKVPKAYKKKASHLLKVFDERANDLTWDAAGNVYIDEQIIPNANFHKLFPALFRKRISKNLTGMADLLKKLHSMGLSEFLGHQSESQGFGTESTESGQNWWYIGE